MAKHFIIIGGGQAAAQAVLTLRQREFEGAITLIGEEPYPPYQRPPLSKKYLAGDLDADRLHLRPQSFYADRNVTLEAGSRVERLDPSARLIELDDGRSLSYDGLLLATGSRVRRLGLPGSDLSGVHYLRTLADADSIRAELLRGRELVIVGAGYIGLEIASVAATLGARVTILEAADRVMSRVVCPEVSEFYRAYHERAGVSIHCNTNVISMSGTDRVGSVEASSGRMYPCDLVVIGIGIEPEVDLAVDAGLDCNDGILVDDHARTSEPDIVAAGDCTNHPSRYAGKRIRLESVQNAVEQAKTAASTLAGRSSPYDQVPWFWSDQYDLKLQITGLSGDGDEVIVRGKPDDLSFSACYLRGGRLVAVDAVNSPRDFMSGRKLIAAEVQVSADQLADTSISLGELL